MARRRYQSGCIRVRGTKQKWWQLQYWEDALDPDGKIVRRQRTSRLGWKSEMTEKQAKRAAAEILRPYNAGKMLPQAAMLLAEFADSIFIPNVFPTLKPSSQRHYRTDLINHILPAFGTMRLGEIGTLDIQRFILRKGEAGLGWASLRRVRAALSVIFTAAKQWGYFAGDNPAGGVKLPKKRRVKEKYVLTPDQFRQLARLLPEPSRTLVALGVLTGMRIGEMLGLAWRDVDFLAPEIRVERSYQRGVMGEPKTDGSKAKLPLTAEISEALRRYRDSAPPTEEGGLIFHTRTGRAYSDTTLMHRQLKPLARRLGMPWLNWHTLRRSHSTLLQSKPVGGTLRDAQAQLRHASATTTADHYTYSIPEQQREAVASLSRYLLPEGWNPSPKCDAKRAEPAPVAADSEQSVANGGDLAGTAVGTQPPVQRIQ